MTKKSNLEKEYVVGVRGNLLSVLKVKKSELELVEIPDVSWFSTTKLFENMKDYTDRLNVDSLTAKTFMFDKLVLPFTELFKELGSKVYLVGRASKVYISTLFFTLLIRGRLRKELAGLYAVVKKPFLVNVVIHNPVFSPCGINEIVFLLENEDKKGFVITPRWNYKENSINAAIIFEFMLNLMNIYIENENLIVLPELKLQHVESIKFATRTAYSYEQIAYRFLVSQDLVRSLERFKEMYKNVRDEILSLGKEPSEFFNDRFSLIKLIV